MEELQQKDQVSMLIMSGDLDKVLAAFLIATSAAAMGSEVVMFFTFWGTTCLRNPKTKVKGKSFIEKMFGFMMPSGAKKLKLSKMEMGGVGNLLIKSVMKKKKIPSLPELIEMAGEMGVKIYVCEMSMDLMGFKQEEIIPYPNIDFCGATKFLEEASSGKVSLFI